VRESTRPICPVLVDETIKAPGRADRGYYHPFWDRQFSSNPPGRAECDDYGGPPVARVRVSDRNGAILLFRCRAITEPP